MNAQGFALLAFFWLLGNFLAVLGWAALVTLRERRAKRRQYEVDEEERREVLLYLAERERRRWWIGQ